MWRLGLGAATRAVPTRSGPALVTPERSQLPDSVGSIVAAPGSEPVYYMSGACLFVNRRVAGTKLKYESRVQQTRIPGGHAYIWDTRTRLAKGHACKRDTLKCKVTASPG